MPVQQHAGTAQQHTQLERCTAPPSAPTSLLRQEIGCRILQPHFDCAARLRPKKNTLTNPQVVRTFGLFLASAACLVHGVLAILPCPAPLLQVSILSEKRVLWGPDPLGVFSRASLAPSHTFPAFHCARRSNLPLTQSTGFQLVRVALLNNLE